MVGELTDGHSPSNNCLGATEGVRSVLSLIKVVFFLGTSVLAALSLGTPVTGVLVTQARESGLAVLAPCCLAGESDVKAATAEPQKDCSCGLVDRLLAAGGLLLASVSSSLLAGTSGLLVKELLLAGGKCEQPPR